MLLLLLLLLLQLAAALSEADQAVKVSLQGLVGGVCAAGLEREREEEWRTKDSSKGKFEDVLVSDKLNRGRLTIWKSRTASSRRSSLDSCNERREADVN